MSTQEQAWLAFRALAHRRGYRIKVVGDYRYARTRSPQSSTIRLVSANTAARRIVAMESNGTKVETSW